MERQFNTAGPSVAGDHYMIDPLSRIDLPEIESLIDAKRYFVLHAPRQTGKTTCLLALMHHLNTHQRYRALYVNIESAQTVRSDVEQGMREIVGAIVSAAALYLDDTRLAHWREEALRARGPHGALTEILARWSQAAERPLVLLLDEVDALVGDTLISLLRQIRAGYAQRPMAFPQTVLLCGVRDVRDYRIHSGGEIITGGSAFNIKAKSLRLGNLERAEVEALYAQHSADTGQVFADGVLDEVWADSRGQPWLVNALAHECTWEDRAARRDRTLPITAERYREARERLIQARATHLDQLVDKLREPRVHRIMQPLLQGEELAEDLPTDDLQYVADLGLIVRGPNGYEIGNRLYAEVIPRELTAIAQENLAHMERPAWYIGADGLDVAKLLGAFQQFFREHSEAWLERFQYKEAGPQLLLQAFLQRIVNGGGRIQREYGLGRRRTDLYLEWPRDRGPVQRVVLELKIRHKSLERTRAEGLAQTADYAARCGADEAHLLIFDRRPGVAWDEKVWRSEETLDGRVIGVWGM